MLSLIARINLPMSFLLYFFWVAGTWWWSITGPLYGSGSGGILILSGLTVVWLPLDLQALFHFVDTCTSLVLPVFTVVSESCMVVF